MPPEIVFQENASLNALNTFGIGGPARYFIEVTSIAKMQATLRHCHAHRLRYFILGKGSNSLFDDRGFNGVVILNKIAFLSHPTQDCIHVGAGYSFSLLGTQTARRSLGGLEFACGIPGSVGGAVFMNAGANGAETFQALSAVDFITDQGELLHLPKTELSYGYRSSCFQKMPGAIVGATFLLSSSPEARAKQLNIINYRKMTQPYSDKSAGCVFRNPAGGHAGALIEQCGLKGNSIGGAQVSCKHANFIINTGAGSSDSVLSLIEAIKTCVKDKTGVELESEIRYIPYSEE